MKVLTILLTSLIISAQTAVLDPALFLAPSPPLTRPLDSLAAERWARVERQAVVDDLTVSTTTEVTDAMETAETFWPGVRTTSYGLRGIHIPLTFSVSGTYGNYAMNNPGIIGSSYASISAEDSDSGFGAAKLSGTLIDGNSNLFSAFGRTGLAGSSYGSYGSGYPGTRIYGGSNGASWSGWGNGKWGHYGKG